MPDKRHVRTRRKRPETRSQCQGGPRPCPWVSCRYHLFLDVNPQTGSIKFNFPEADICDLEHSCALDLADEGELTFEEIGNLLNLTRERIRQMTNQAVDCLGDQICPDTRRSGGLTETLEIRL